VCTEFSTARSNGKARNPEEGMFLVKECQRIIAECNPTFWVIENPAKGVLKNYLDAPTYEYEPWWYDEVRGQRKLHCGESSTYHQEDTGSGKKCLNLKDSIKDPEDQNHHLHLCTNHTISTYQNFTI